MSKEADELLNDVSNLTLLPPPTKPYSVARRYVKTHARIVCWQQTFHRWRNGYYHVITEQHLRDLLYPWLDNAYYMGPEKDGKPQKLAWNPNAPRVSLIIDALRSLCVIPDGMQNGSWLKEHRAPKLTGNLRIIVPTTIGLVHVGDNGQEILEAITPDFFCLYAVPLPAEAVRTGFYQAYLKSRLHLADDDITYINEMHGSAIANWSPEQKAHMLVGPPRSGKGTLVRLLSYLIGKGKASAPITVTDMTETFGKSKLVGKAHIAVHEARGRPRDQDALLSFILSAIGGDELPIHRKYKEDWIGSLNALWQFVTNRPSAYRDASGASTSRFTGLNFGHSFAGDENPHIEAQLREDVWSVFESALLGLHRLIDQRHFTVPESWLPIAEELESGASPEILFLKNRCQPGDWISRITFKQEFERWCIDEDRKVQFSEANMRAAAATLGWKFVPSRFSMAEAKKYNVSTRIRIYRGIKPGPERSLQVQRAVARKSAP
jgi:putative DNA primase/helicase